MKNSTKPKIYKHHNFRKCGYCQNSYYGYVCERMEDYLIDEYELCPCQFDKEDRRYCECPYYEPQATIDEEEEMKKYYGDYIEHREANNEIN